MPRKTKRLYISVETTGPQPIVHNIYSLSALIEIDGKETDKSVYPMRPYGWANIDPDQLPVPLDTLKTYPNPSDVYLDFIKWLHFYDDRHHPHVKYTPVCIGNTFEFVNTWADIIGRPDWSLLQNYRQVDALSLARLMCDWGDKGLNNLANHRLVTLCHFFKIPLPEPGLASVLAMREVYKQLMRRMAQMVRGEK